MEQQSDNLSRFRSHLIIHFLPLNVNFILNDILNDHAIIFLLSSNHPLKLIESLHIFNIVEQISSLPIIVYLLTVRTVLKTGVSYKRNDKIIINHKIDNKLIINDNILS